MVDKNSRTEVTSADSTQLGFEHQYLYFILKLLELTANQEVGYEALDDIHIISHDDETAYFFQLKHTIETDSSGEQANLATLSTELWKTLSNWSKVICDPTENRNTAKAQKEFLAKASFELVINRNVDNNEVVQAIRGLQDDAITGKKLRELFQGLYEKTKDTTIKAYISTVLELSAPVLSLFMKKTSFVNTPNVLFDQIRIGIMSKMVAAEYVNDVLSELYLQLKEDMFNKVQNGSHQVITYAEWISKYHSIFSSKRSTLLPFRRYEPPLPERLEHQPFVKELVEIGAVEPGAAGIAEVAELTRYYLNVKLQLEDWYNDGRLTFTDIERFHSEAALCWKRIHQARHRTTKSIPEKDFENALQCFDAVMQEKLGLLSTELGTSLSNGEFIKLANDARIGWKISWKERYHESGDEYAPEQ